MRHHVADMHETWKEQSPCSTASPTAANATQDVVERAGNASFRSRDPSDPLSPLQLDADVDWNADTGATSHMTPHHHWLRNYSPKRVPIKLADNTVVYSAGVGSVVFHPTLEGKRGRAVEFSNVLHVPQLRNNLLAVLYLTRRSSFDVHINATHMSFSRSNGPPLFVAPINEHNVRQLDQAAGVRCQKLNCNATEHTNIPGVRCQKLKSTDIGLAGSMYRVTNNHT
jgi:hypothetical protein